jgi:hypothetical protein
MVLRVLRPLVGILRERDETAHGGDVCVSSPHGTALEIKLVANFGLDA